MITQEELNLTRPGKARSLIRRYWTLCKISFQERMENRLNTFFYMVMVLVPALTGIYLWTKVLNSGNNPATLQSITTYYVVATFVGWRVASFQWLIMYDIREGRMANFVLRPMSYPATCFWYEVGGRSWSTLMTLPVFVVLAVALGPNFKAPDDPLTWLLAILALLLAFVMNYFITAAMGLLTIWQNQPEGFFWLYDVAARGLGGTLIPLAYMPLGLGDWLQWLPFAYIFSLPARIFQGLPAAQIVQGFTVQLVWLALSALLFNWMWRLAQRRYEAYEG